jgi:hypothetical protein
MSTEIRNCRYVLVHNVGVRPWLQHKVKRQTDSEFLKRLTLFDNEEEIN